MIAKHKLDFKQNYNGLSEHSAITIITPEDITSNEVADIIENAAKSHPTSPLTTLLDDVVSTRKGWAWKEQRYDAVVRLPTTILMTGDKYHRKEGELKQK